MRMQVPSEHQIKSLRDLCHDRSYEVRCRSCAYAGLVVDKLPFLVIFLETSQKLYHIRVL